MEKILQNLYEDFTSGEGNLIGLLQEIQRAFGYIPEEAVHWFARKLDVPASRFYGVATFYSQFYLTPRGRNIVTACCGTACHVKGSERLINGLAKELNLGESCGTTEDKQFTLERVNCVGACSIAPVVIINEKIYGKVSADALMKEIRGLKEREDGP